MALIVSGTENPGNRFLPVTEDCTVVYACKGAKLTSVLYTSLLTLQCEHSFNYFLAVMRVYS